MTMKELKRKLNEDRENIVTCIRDEFEWDLSVYLVVRDVINNTIGSNFSPAIVKVEDLGKIKHIYIDVNGVQLWVDIMNSFECDEIGCFTWEFGVVGDKVELAKGYSVIDMFNGVVIDGLKDVVVNK